jgi:hypothetical protein
MFIKEIFEILFSYLTEKWDVIVIFSLKLSSFYI